MQGLVIRAKEIYKERRGVKSFMGITLAAVKRIRTRMETRAKGKEDCGVQGNVGT